jgi:hypothetical protein
VAQPGSALAWGARGRRFKSCRPEKKGYSNFPKENLNSLFFRVCFNRSARTSSRRATKEGELRFSPLETPSLGHARLCRGVEDFLCFFIFYFYFYLIIILIVIDLAAYSIFKI